MNDVVINENGSGSSKRLREAAAAVAAEREDKLAIIQIEHLSATFPTRNAKLPLGPRVVSKVPYSNVMLDDSGVITNVVLRSSNEPTAHECYMRCGPRPELFFDPSRVTAAIVTCGGLCPGLNSVVRDITLSLKDLYGCQKVLGFHGGWEGIYARPPIVLTRESTNGIQNLGGTVLCSARGGFDADKITRKLDELGVDQLYVVGGDGTMRGANALCEALKHDSHLKRPIAIIGVPKTIDNDIDLIDRSFGFQTAVEETLRAVRAARVEAMGSINGVGIVKVMGRSAGFIATHTTLASGDVDLCLISEVPIIADGGEHCHFSHILHVVQERGCAVIVVAEGAGEEVLGQSAEKDAGGNRKLPEIGPWVKDQVNACSKRANVPCTVKFIDPSYMVRSGPANASDALYCLILSQGAVHAAMAGLTNCTVGLVNGRSVLIPIEKIVATSPRQVDPRGRTWERVVSLTGQPNPETELKSKGKGLMSHTVL